MSIAQNFPNIKPSLMLSFADTKQLDPRITYTRASTATFYNGVTTAMAEQNLLLYSQQFDDGYWIKNATTVSANATTAPDGTTTAETLVEAATTAFHTTVSGLIAFVSGNSYVFSIYAKNATSGRGLIQLGGYGYFGGNAYANFDIVAGTVTQSANATASITSIGSGWYRCVAVVSCNFTGNERLNVGLINSGTDVAFSTTYLGDVTKGIHIWGAQVEQRNAVTAYTATTTQAITNYIPKLQTAASGVARFDNNPTTGESLGLLIEESRTNLQTYSSQFDNAAWTKSALTITADTVVAPDGTLTADGFIESTASAIRFAYQGLTLTAASYTLSVYARRSTGSQRWLSLYPQGTGVTASAIYDVNNGTVTATAGAQYLSSTITSVGNNWYRCTLTFTGAAVSVLPVIYISNASNAAAPNYTGDGFSGLYLWGMQLEAGSFATSYIPTVASQVTRAADAASMTGTNFSTWYNQGEGTLYSEAKLLATPGGATYPGIVKISTDSANKIGFWTIPAATSMYFSVSANSTSSADISIAQSPVSNFVKISGVYKVNDFAASVNASTVGTDTSGVIPVVNKMDIGTYDNSWNGTIKKIAYYPLRVTNAQLQSLTS